MSTMKKSIDVVTCADLQSQCHDQEKRAIFNVDNQLVMSSPDKKWQGHLSGLATFMASFSNFAASFRQSIQLYVRTIRYSHQSKKTIDHAE